MSYLTACRRQELFRPISSLDTEYESHLRIIEMKRKMIKLKGYTL
jgi:hypothetical protein